ncbi:MAG: hypothetical protein ACOCYG_05285 [Spirochaetota bacterium]
MRRLAIIVVCLLAVFTLINAYTGDSDAPPAHAGEHPVEDIPIVD